MLYENDDGCVSFHADVWNDGEMVISRLYVKPDRRGHKAGYKLLDWVKNWAQTYGYNALNLEVWPFEALGHLEEISMTKALIKYYSAYGFKSMKSNKARMKLKLLEAS